MLNKFTPPLYSNFPRILLPALSHSVWWVSLCCFQIYICSIFPSSLPFSILSLSPNSPPRYNNSGFRHAQVGEVLGSLTPRSRPSAQETAAPGFGASCSAMLSSTGGQAATPQLMQPSCRRSALGSLGSGQTDLLTPQLHYRP
jgi:hypothetical protein